MITAEQVLEFFRHEDLEETIHNLGEFDKREIILACAGHCDFLHTQIENVLDKWEDNHEGNADMKESITIVWDWSDVQQVGECLTKEQCCKVLETLEKTYDCNLGINWDMIEITIRDLYGEEGLRQKEEESKDE